MFLKSLVLRGYKTFADLTKIEFSPEARITAIVGPNGCGKSNLMDAVRWVLGEDNPRELRVATLDNIIFAGTAERKPVSLAEVALTFDNSAAKFPIAYSEVSIKRRTFREGESEFFINKNLCRLKDIKDLLLDTGLGEGTYSIITQGQVDAILSSKGDERRAVFEEAAGINKYKSRKLAAEKKLIAAEQNILRINDLKIEVNEHLLSLEEQARKAREYLEIQKHVKESDIGLSKKVLGALVEKRARLQEELEKAKKASEEKMAAEKKDEEELAAAREALRQTEIGIEEQFSRLDSEKDRLRDLELDRRFVEGELRREQLLLEELESKKQEIRQKIEALLHPDESSFALSASPVECDVNQIIEAAGKLVTLLSGIVSFFGKGTPFSLAGPSDKEETRRLKLELLDGEERKAAGEIERVKFGLQAHQIELQNLPAAGENLSAKDALLRHIARLKQEKEVLNQKINALEIRIRRELKSGDSSSSLEIALAKLEGEMNGLCEKLYLEYNLSLDEIQSQPYEVSNAARARTEVEEGKQRMRALEPVNLLAIEEFEKTRERLSFIEAQLADLNEARDHLRNLIVELDARAEENFVQTMQQLSQVFSETFSRLFSGGEARIALSAGAPALEAEIEISVRPTGRKWLPLPQLSGGERALSAIAILFSLLKIRPSPFCFLDEVDAALDEANIGRFAEIVKDFSSTSQIMVITHNKCTMSVADQIYGITMEEPGVSKVISMKLTEVAA
jgi:chromosome segregation protein